MFSQEKCFVFMRNYFGKIKSFYHVLIKHKHRWSNMLWQIIGQEGTSLCMMWVPRREFPARTQHSCAMHSSAMLKAPQKHTQKRKTLHTLRILQVNVCIPHKLIESLIIIIFSIYCLALLDESQEHIIVNEAMRSKANPLRCVVQHKLLHFKKSFYKNHRNDFLLMTPWRTLLI